MMTVAWKRGTGLGDVRLDERAALVFEQMISTHSVVLKKLGSTRAGALGAGRLLASGKVDTEGLLAPHVARTAEAVRDRRIVAAQDTTEINFAGRDKRRRGLGPAGDGVSKGFFIHPVIAIDAEDEAVLGVAAAELWTRDDEPVRHRHSRAFGDKESARWLRGAEQAAERLCTAASIVVVGDRESDIYEVFANKPALIDYVIRARHDRTLVDGRSLCAAAAAFTGLGSAFVRVASKGIGDKGRTARVVIKAGCIGMRLRAGAKTERRAGAKTERRAGAKTERRAVDDPASIPASMTLGVVEVIEADPPVGVPPLHWRLLTTLPVATLGDACEIVRLYRLRWRIEEVFRTLKKDGMRLEETQVVEAAAVMNLAALALAAAVRIVQLVDARDGSTRPATDVIDKSQFTAVSVIIARREGKTARQKNPWPAGSLAWVAWLAARLGGWDCYGKKPGPKTMADGWHRLSLMLDGYQMARTAQDV